MTEMDGGHKISANLMFKISIMFYSVILVIGQSIKTIPDGDFWGYMAFGKLFAEDGVFPYKDVFSYVPTKDIWIYHEWLTGIILYYCYSIFGEIGIQLLRFLIALIVAGITYKIARLNGASAFGAALAIIFISWVPGFYLPFRAGIFSLLLFCLTIYCLEMNRICRRRFYLICLLPIFVVWPNLHGAFLVGILIIFIFAASESIKIRKASSLLLVAIACSLVGLVNPYGIDYYMYLVSAVLMPRPDIPEWQSFLRVFMLLGYNWTFVTIIIATLLVPFYIFYHHRERLHSSLAMTLFGISFIWSYRHVVFFMLIFAMYIPLLFDRIIEVVIRWYNKRKQINNKAVIDLDRVQAFITSALVVVVIASVIYIIGNNPLKIDIKKSNSIFPAEAFKFIKTNQIKGNILPYYRWGEYILWEFSPQCKVGFDGRYETVYPDRYSERYFDFYHLRKGMDEFLNDFDHDFVFVQCEKPIYTYMHNNAKWKEIYRDEVSAIFKRW